MTLLRTARWYRDQSRINPRSWKRKGLKLHCLLAFPRTGHRAALPICAVPCVVQPASRQNSRAPQSGITACGDKLAFPEEGWAFFCNAELCSLRDGGKSLCGFIYLILYYYYWYFLWPEPEVSQATHRPVLIHYCCLRACTTSKQQPKKFPQECKSAPQISSATNSCNNLFSYLCLFLGTRQTLLFYQVKHTIPKAILPQVKFWKSYY